MDLNTITHVVRRPSEQPGADWREGDAWLAGGTWLYSVEQPDLSRLIDLTALRWEPLVQSEQGLEIGATCTIRDLYAQTWPLDWTAGILFHAACEAFLSSFKVWNAATVGGNICMALPAGPMITLAVALEARCELWAPDGSRRFVDALDFVTGEHRNILTPGEILRRVTLPAHALRRRTAHRRFSLTRLGRSTVFLVGTQGRGGTDLSLTLTAGTTRPVRLDFASVPDARTLRRRIDALLGRPLVRRRQRHPEHRRHLTYHFAEEIRRELTAGDLP
ncbi:FAD binding domain-containing protein [Streptomyces lasalocidi]